MLFKQESADEEYESILVQSLWGFKAWVLLCIKH